MVWVILFYKTVFFHLTEQNKVKEIGETEEILFYVFSLKVDVGYSAFPALKNRIEVM